MSTDSALTRTDVAEPAGRARPWFVLMLAGVFEVGYALSVGGSQGFTVLS